MCLLDASSSKAFDRVKHSVLFSKLGRLDVVSLDILLDCYAIGMTDRLCVLDGAIHYQIPFT